MSETGFLCRCSVCNREERTGSNPLRDGWPMCHGYTMTLIESERFTESIDSAVNEMFGPVRAMREAAHPHE